MDLLPFWGCDRTVPLAVPAILLVLVLPAWETVDGEGEDISFVLPNSNPLE